MSSLQRQAIKQRIGGGLPPMPPSGVGYGVIDALPLYILFTFLKYPGVNMSLFGPRAFRGQLSCKVMSILEARVISFYAFKQFSYFIISLKSNFQFPKAKSFIMYLHNEGPFRC